MLSVKVVFLFLEQNVVGQEGFLCFEKNVVGGCVLNKILSVNAINNN